ncbi:PO113 [Hepatospora eriocheir]|uniref:PO113 n=1 Tax=Hepatospora eriocheir TaxID=1081669 RepID=A0A1X0QAT9_9MICR|nr:PO113 [Hepatospora eriocheir]
MCQQEVRRRSQEYLVSLKSRHINDIWEIDLIELPESLDDFKYVLTGIDVYSKFGFIHPIIDKSSEEILIGLKKFIKEVGKPNKILSDNGLEFKNNRVEGYLLAMQIEIKHGSPYTPTTQGVIERFNRTFKSKLRRTREFGKLDWKNELKVIIKGYNYCKSRATGYAPIEFFNGSLCIDADNNIFLKTIV